MKTLRILTGRHAGASLPLAPGEYRIGGERTADVCLSDWQGPQLVLDADESGVVRARRESRALAHEGAGAPMEQGGETGEAGADGAQDPGTVLLLDYVPMPFGEVVLCVGDDALPWPSDLVLLQTVFRKPPAAAVKSNYRAAIGVVSICLVASGLAFSVLLGSARTSDAAGYVVPSALKARATELSDAFARAGLRDLTVGELDSHLVVTGMVPDPQGDQRARALIDEQLPYPVDVRYNVATTIVQSLLASLEDPGIKVSYEGEGRFKVTGQVANPMKLRAAVDRVRDDIGANVKQISIDSAGISLPGPSYSALLTQGDLGYMQTNDGVKHVFIGGGDARAAAFSRPPGESQ